MKFRITNANTAPVVAYLQKLSPAKEYDVTVSIHRQKRSIPQNALYWMWMSCIAEELGSDRNQCHEDFGNMFLPKIQVKGIGNEYNERPVSTTTLDTAQFTAYLDQVQAFAASELGIVLPTPEDRIFEGFMEFYQDRI